MLYQTHHPLFFRFRSTFPLSSPFQEMECVEAALKTSFRKEMALKSSPQPMALKSSPQAFLDDFWAVNWQNGASADDFSVDELFDFSNGDGFFEPTPAEEDDEDETETIKAGLVSSFSVSPRKQNPQITTQSPGLNFGSGELAVPADEEKDLEWLSHFVEDSNSEYCAPFPAGPTPESSKSRPAEPEKPPITYFKSPVPAKARSKRARTGCRVWSLSGTPSVTFTESSSSSTSSSSSCSPPGPWLIYATPSSGSISTLEPPSSENPPAKKQRKKHLTDSTGGGTAQPQRRCSHCGVMKTPQWRAGPLGAKTLCNACGVRFKSGRLLPEYRPACSPTFSSELHSNHHRKVLEMRRKKETVGTAAAEAGLVVAVVPSF